MNKIIRMTVAALALMAAGSTSATVYTWNGAANDGDWTNTENWDANGVPVDAVDDSDTNNGLGLTLTEGDSILFNGTNAPTNNFPGIGGGNTTGASSPTMALNSGGTFNLNMNSRESSIWTMSSGSTRDVITVGDGVGKDDVVLNLTGMKLPSRYKSATVRYVVKADGTLNFNENFGGTIDCQQGTLTDHNTQFIIEGGVINIDGTLTQLEVGENQVEFTTLGGLFTANYGDSYADFSAVSAAVEEGVYWVNNSGGLLRVADNGTSFTVYAVTKVVSSTNPSFELPELSADGGVYSGDVAGWTTSGGTIGVFNPSTSFYTNSDVTDSNGGVLGDMDENQALFFADNSNQTITQTLAENAVPGTTYALTVAVGDRDAGGRTEFAGYDIRLLVDGVAVATTSSTSSPGDGTFADIVLVYTAQDGDSGALGIQIGTSNAGAGKALDVDHVRLVISDAPFIVVDSPQDRQVVQRDLTGQAILDIGGTIWGGAGTEVQARALAIDGNGTDTDWVMIDSAPTTESFTGTLTLNEGWYQVEVRLLDGEEVVLTGTLERVGVGDIFITAGQSNSCNFGAGTPSAADDRVSYLGLRDGLWVHADDPPANPSDFGGSGGSPWPKLGDLLAEADDVPIAFVSIGRGSSSVYEWTPARNLYYTNLVTAVETLGVNGFRAVLWHQGERDAATSAEVYAAYLDTVIAASRVDAGWTVPWGIALASYTSEINQSTIDGQQQVIDNDLRVFAGADTDTLIGLPYRSGVHFAAEGLTAHAELWFGALNDAFPEFKMSGVSVAGTNAMLSFAGFTGEKYEVEMTESLNPVDWQTVTNIDSLGESPFSVGLDTTNNAAFYRVKLIP